MSNFKPIKSSNLKEAKYDAKSKVMVVKFQKGYSYKYPDTDDHLWNDFESRFDGTKGSDGKSAGQFFNANIRHRPSEKIEE